GESCRPSVFPCSRGTAGREILVKLRRRRPMKGDPPPLAREAPLRILLAEDDTTTRLKIRSLLVKWGYDVVSATNGTEAWSVLEGDHPPTLALLDWKMPGLDGVEICQRLRSPTRHGPYVYVLL